ncbi:MAG: helix-turn-helix domain-containing protein [Oscillospiraceae bacterium]|nr:helix-turn-helix domain-containing protein [Oscillospiraceae bacterium]
MININLSYLRKQNGYTQEEVAEKIGVSRQAVAKWEKGESVPDIYNCTALAELFNVTVDDLINYTPEGAGPDIPPKGKYFFGSVTVGDRGQIVIPKKARTVFGINPGDQLIMFGDEDRGLGIIPKRSMAELLRMIALGDLHFKHNKEGKKDE